MTPFLRRESDERLQQVIEIVFDPFAQHEAVVAGNSPV
jgi:hypothetical protein